MTINSIVQFLITAGKHASRDALIADLEYFLADCRIDFYGVFEPPKLQNNYRGNALAGRWPEGWVDHYRNRKYLLIDPTFRYLGYTDGGFRWGECISAFADSNQAKKMRRLIDDAARFGMRDGYTFPIHNRQGLLGHMTIVARNLHLTSGEIALFEQVAKSVFHRLLSFEGSASREKDSVIPALTKREMEVLFFLTDGLTSQEIGKNLKLSSHTVDWYMNALQEKLGAKNRQHTVALAFRRGLVS